MRQSRRNNRAKWYRSGLLGAASLVAPCLAASAVAASSLTPPLVLTQLPLATAAERSGPRCDGMLAAEWGEGARLVRVDGAGTVTVLTPGFAGAADPEVSFDGARILFAGQRAAGERWAIYEMNIDGSGVRLVYATDDDLRQPLHLPTVHTIVADPTKGTEAREHLAFVRTFAALVNEHGGAPTSALFTVTRDGSQPRRLTLAPSNERDPVVLGDGRVLYSSWQRATLARGTAGRRSLVGVNLDGLDPALFAADEGDRVKAMPCVARAPDRLAETFVVFVEAETLGWDGAGHLAAVSLRRNLHSHRRLTSDADGLFHSPAGLPDGSVVAARRPADGSGSHAIVRVDPATGRVEPLFDDPAWHDLQPRPLVARAVPDGRSTATADPDRHGESAAPEAVAFGSIYGLDVYQTTLAPPPPRGSVTRVRVVEGVPTAAVDANRRGPVPQAGRRVVGETPVEADGSFHAQVPAATPLQLQLLDRDGLAVASSGWLWVPYKGRQGCVGCHEDGELAPANRFVDALTRPATVLLQPPAERRTVDFRHDLAPLVASRCVACHGAGASVRLDATDAYDTLLTGVAATVDRAVAGRWVTPGSARTSPLIWHLLGRAPDGVATPATVPPRPDALTADELRLFVEWVDLGAAWDARGSEEPEGGPP